MCGGGGDSGQGLKPRRGVLGAGSCSGAVGDRGASVRECLRGPRPLRRRDGGAGRAKGVAAQPRGPWQTCARSSSNSCRSASSSRSRDSYSPRMRLCSCEGAEGGGRGVRKPMRGGAAGLADAAPASQLRPQRCCAIPTRRTSGRSAAPALKPVGQIQPSRRRGAEPQSAVLRHSALPQSSPPQHAPLSRTPRRSAQLGPSPLRAASGRWASPLAGCRR